MVFFTSEQTGFDIPSLMREYGATVWTSIEDVPSYALDGISVDVLDRVDGIVLDIANHSPNFHYLLAQSIVLQKPTLCLYPESSPPRDILKHLYRKNIPKTIHKVPYTESSIRDIIRQFVTSVQPAQRRTKETPNIKFTLRLTESLDEYLAWLSDNYNINKAEYIRKLIEQQRDNDSNYRNA